MASSALTAAPSMRDFWAAFITAEDLDVSSAIPVLINCLDWLDANESGRPPDFPDAALLREAVSAYPSGHFRLGRGRASRQKIVAALAADVRSELSKEPDTKKAVEAAVLARRSSVPPQAAPPRVTHGVGGFFDVGAVAPLVGVLTGFTTHVTILVDRKLGRLQDKSTSRQLEELCAERRLLGSWDAEVQTQNSPQMQSVLSALSGQACPPDISPPILASLLDRSYAEAITELAHAASAEKRIVAATNPSSGGWASTPLTPARDDTGARRPPVPTPPPKRRAVEALDFDSTGVVEEPGVLNTLPSTHPLRKILAFHQKTASAELRVPHPISVEMARET